ncbi:MYCBP-associated protein-like isoform X2 [Pomacea canaliculata]|nr:MYCBP-associated protein-like isoform X2 [Pomacea canaliculata]
MSSRRGSKVLGNARDRRMSVVAGQAGPPNRTRKKRDGTPDKSATPSQEAQDENRPPSRQIIWDAEIEKLQIKPDDLEKVRVPKSPSSPPPSLVTVTVRKTKPASELNKSKIKQVMVAKAAPPDAPLKPIDYSGHAGPRYDSAGRVIHHSILGTYDEYRHEATIRGDLLDIPTPRIVDGFSDEKPTLKYEKKLHHVKKQQSEVEESNALRNWQLKMLERKRQQGYISKLLQKPPEDLAMNRTETYRKTQEDRYLIDRTIPFIDNGKGYRIGSEFWRQQERIGDELAGIHVTLTQTECGYPPPVEHIGIPQNVRQEKGMTWDQDYSSPVHHSWQSSSYLHARLKLLQPVINELDPHKPDFSGLEVIGTNNPYKKDHEKDKDNILHMNYEGQAAFDQPSQMTKASDVNISYDDRLHVRSPPFFGPSLIFAGQVARWTGDGDSMVNQVGIEARIIFEAYTGKRVISYLEVINDGTTSVFYDWKKLAKENVFNLVQRPVQKFYFNDSSGVILPGEILKVPFMFKSECAGVYTEQWVMETRPVLCGGAALVVALRGVCLQEDTFQQQRRELEHDLEKKQSQQVVRQLVEELVSGIRTPERPRSPVDAYITEEELFHRHNPGLSYCHALVQELKQIHSQLFTEEEREYAIWDLSVLDLEDLIMELDEEDERKEDLLARLNAAVAKLTFTPQLPVQQRKENICHQLLAEAVDAIVGQSMLLRSMLGLPPRDIGDAMDDTDTKKGQRPGDKGKPEKAETSKDKKPAAPGGGTVATPAAAAATPVKAGKGQKEAQKTEPKGKVGAGKKVAGPARSTGATPAGGSEPPTASSTSPPRTPESLEQDIAIDHKYREKLAVQAFQILGDKVAKMESIFQAMGKLELGVTFTQRK